MKAIKTELKNAENTKKILIDKKILNTKYRIKKDKTHIYFPIIRDYDTTNFEVVDTILEEVQKEEKNLKNLLKDKLTSQELESLKTAFDVVGDIAILEIDDALRNKEQIIANTLLDTHKNIKTVLRKDDKHEGDFRTQKMKWLAGENTKETIHKENNVTLKVNVEEVYFSPRLSNERKRISKQVQENEEILVMFSGGAPYPCALAKNTKAKHITGIELNPKGHEIGLENLNINKIHNVTLICGDVRTQTNNVYTNIIGVKSANLEDELKSRLELAPKIFEFHLFKEDLYENKKQLENTINELKQKKIKTFIHMPFPEKNSKLLGETNVTPIIDELKILGDICKEHDAKAIIHISNNQPDITEQELITNIKKLKNYYDQFYFENTTNFFNKTEDIVRIGKKAGIKNMCIDISHLYIVYKSNKKIIKHIQEIQKHFNTYFHIADSNGDMDAQKIGTGKIKIDEILPYVNQGIAEIRSKSEKNPKEMITSYNELIQKQRTYDRILMPLPKNAEDFLDTALSAVKKGTIIHLYNFLHEDEFDEIEKKVKDACTAKGLKYKKIALIKCGQQSPRTYRICLDFKVL